MFSRLNICQSKNLYSNSFYLTLCLCLSLSLSLSLSLFLSLSLTLAREYYSLTGGSFTVRQTSCFTCLDSAVQVMLNNNRFTCLVESNSAKQEVSKTYSDTSPVSEYSQSYALGSFLSYFTYLCLFFCFSNHLDDALIFARVISSFEVRSTIYYFNFQIPNIRFFHFFQTLFVSKNYIAQNVHFVDLRLGRKWLMPSA